MMVERKDLDPDLRMAYDNHMMAVRNGNREQIENTKLIFDMLIDEKNQKNHQKNQNNP
jgi:hypothetical protein